MREGIDVSTASGNVLAALEKQSISAAPLEK